MKTLFKPAPTTGCLLWFRCTPDSTVFGDDSPKATVSPLIRYPVSAAGGWTYGCAAVL